MELAPEVCHRARLARDPRFDGLFFIGVLSTGVFCRPVCPARQAKREQVVFFPTAAAAIEAGLRPCLRCRPETAPGSPAWNGTSATVSRALVLIRQGALNSGDVESLAARVGVGSRHLRRLFKAHVGASPQSIAMSQRVLFAKNMLTQTDMDITDIAFAAGFGSVRRFHAAFVKIFAASPSCIRRKRSAADHSRHSPRCAYRLHLPYRPPFDWEQMLAFFAARAIPGVEQVTGETYHRTVQLAHSHGTIAVSPSPGKDALILHAVLTSSRDLLSTVERVRRMFDLDASMDAIHAVLRNDPDLAPLIIRRPGLRLPGSWDPFETAVRAIVGQQVTIRQARQLLERIVAETGLPLGMDHPQLTHVFPPAQVLAGRQLGAIAMPTTRRQAITRLAREVDAGNVLLEIGGSLDEQISGLGRIDGVGDWTAQYIAMRALSEPDAFPAGDVGIAKALQRGDRRPTVGQIRKRAEAWRPWRAYAAIHLWHQ